MRGLFSQASFILLLPAFERRKELPHLLLCLLGCQIPARFLVYLIGKLRAELYHLAHVKVLGEFPLLVAIDAVVFIRITIGIRPFVGIIKRHTATLTKFLYHVSLLFFACQSVYRQVLNTKIDKNPLSRKVAISSPTWQQLSGVQIMVCF